MEITALQRQVKAADLAPERLAANGAISEKEKLSEASRQFEALLLRQVLGDAQKPVFDSPLVKDSTSASIYRDMITNQLADSISKSGGFGLAKVLEPQLQHQMAARKPGANSLQIAGGGGETAHKLPRSSLDLGNRFAVQVPKRATATPAHAALLMQQLGERTKHLKSHE